MSVTVCIFISRHDFISAVRIVHQVSAGIDLTVAPEIQAPRGFSGRAVERCGGFQSIWGYQKKDGLQWKITR